MKKTSKTTKPIRRKEEVAQNPDERIDQDFPGFPHSPSKVELIKPETKEEKLTAGLQRPRKRKK